MICGRSLFSSTSVSMLFLSVRKFIVFLFLLTQAPVSVSLANGDRSHTATPAARPDSHAPLGVMGDHAHSSGEWMLSYRFMRMRMENLRDGVTTVSVSDALRHFPVVPVEMQMQMHMFGLMIAPHDHVTLMAMTSYRDHVMQMQGSGTHAHSHGGNDAHQMESAGLGDTTLSGLIPVLRSQNIVVLLNAGLSIPTGSIEAQSDNGILPYPMQLGSGSFELLPGLTFYATRNNWSFGGQTRAAIPMNENSRGYRRAPMTASTLWAAHRLNDWLSVSTRALFENWGNIAGADEALNPEMAPTMDARLQGGARGSLLIGSNLVVPDVLGSLLAGQRFALELRVPIYQHLDGPQMALDWSVVAGWQYAFTFNRTR